MVISIITIFGLIGVIFSVLTYFYSIKKTIDLCKRKEKYSSLPAYTRVENLINYFVCSCWLVYSYLINDKYLLFSNLIGTAVFLFWIIFVFLIYSRHKRCFTYTIYIFLEILFLPIIYFLFNLTPIYIAGNFCMIVYFLSFLSYFLNIKEVITTRNHRLINVWLYIVKMIAHLCWFIYGFIKINMNVVVPHVIGFIFVFIALFFWNNYKKKSNSERLSNRSVDIMRNRAEFSI